MTAPPNPVPAEALPLPDAALAAAAAALAARESACLAALNTEPALPDTLLQLARLRLDQGRASEAITFARACLALAPALAHGLAPGAAAGLLGLALIADGQYAQAAQQLEQALQGDAQALPVRLALARALLVLDRNGDAAQLFAPPFDALADADARCMQGRTLLAVQHPLPALHAFDAAAALAPGHPQVLLGRGLALLALGRAASALASLHTAVQAAPLEPEMPNELGLALGKLGYFNEAVRWFERALQLDRHYAPAYRYLGNALTMLRLDREALACLREARRLRPDWNAIWLDEAGVLLRGGRLQEGWRAYERRQSARVARGLAGDHYWLGDADLAGQSIILLAEQGLGDTLNFVRYAPLIRAMGAEVTLEVQRALLPLIEPLAQEWDVQVVGQGVPHAPTQWQTLLLSLPHACGTSAATIPGGGPYLSAPASYREKWRDALAPRLRAGAVPDASTPGAAPGQAAVPRMRIGLVCAGNPKYPDDAIRSVKLEVFRPLLDLPGIDWFWLQPDIRAGDQVVLDAYPQVCRIGAQFADFADTAAVVEQLDLVISVDTSVAHLAGALGVPVWILISFLPDWRWMLDRSDTPWYGCATLFRQSGPADWPGVVTRLVAALQARLLAWPAQGVRC